MQKLITLIIVCLLTLGAGAQTTSKPKIGSSNSLDSLVQLGTQMNTILMAKEELNGRYKLYKTENIYTFLKLNTANGILSQIQWSTSDNEGTVDFLNSHKAYFSVLALRPSSSAGTGFPDLSESVSR